LWRHTLHSTEKAGSLRPGAETTSLACSQLCCSLGPCAAGVPMMKDRDFVYCEVRQQAPGGLYIIYGESLADEEAAQARTATEKLATDVPWQQLGCEGSGAWGQLHTVAGQGCAGHQGRCAREDGLQRLGGCSSGGRSRVARHLRLCYRPQGARRAARSCTPQWVSVRTQSPVNAERFVRFDEKALGLYRGRGGASVVNRVCGSFSHESAVDSLCRQVAMTLCVCRGRSRPRW